MTDTIQGLLRYQQKDPCRRTLRYQQRGAHYYHRYHNHYELDYRYVNRHLHTDWCQCWDFVVSVPAGQTTNCLSVCQISLIMARH